jgi:predicted RNase H-like nuclease (RuvC/YqgF family)
VTHPTFVGTKARHLQRRVVEPESEHQRASLASTATAWARSEPTLARVDDSFKTQ